MKISISTHEGTPEFLALSADMDDEVNLSDFIDRLEVLLRAMFFEDLVLDIKRKGEE